MQLGPNDLPILRELLGWGTDSFPRGSLAVSTRDIATRTGLHRNTVQRRIDALQEGGVIEGYVFEPHPALLGLVRAGHRLDGISARTTDELAQALAPFPWVSVAILHLDACFLHTYHTAPADVEDDIAQITRALDATRTLLSFRSDHWPPMPVDAFPVSDLDRRILVALRRGPRRSVQQIADTARANRRTTARRLDRLVQVGAGAMLPVFRPARIQGMVIAVFEGPAGPDKESAMANAFPDRLMGPVMAGPRIAVIAPATTMDDAVHMHQEARRDPRLSALELQFMRDGLFPVACDDWLRSHVQDVQNAPPAEANP